MGTLRKRGNTWYLRYYRKGRSYEVAARTTSKQAAQDKLDQIVGRVKSGKRVSPKLDRFRFEEAAADLLNEFRVNERKSFAVVERRIRLHLEPYFGGWRMVDITTTDVRDYIVQRQGETTLVRQAYDFKLKDGTVRRIAEHRRPIARVTNAEINRELAILKRMFTLAIQHEKLLDRPHIPMLREHSTRIGFFEREQFERVLAHLPAALRPVIAFAYITGWRIASEILPLQWRQVASRRAKCASTRTPRRTTTAACFHSPMISARCWKRSMPNTSGSGRPDTSFRMCSTARLPRVVAA